MKLTKEQRARIARIDLAFAKLAAKWKAEDAAGVIQEPDDLPESDATPKGQITAILISKRNISKSKNSSPKNEYGGE